jgi:hypothetical protein
LSIDIYKERERKLINYLTWQEIVKEPRYLLDMTKFVLGG